MVNYTRYWSYMTFRKKSKKYIFSPFCLLPVKWYVVKNINTCFYKIIALFPSFLEHVYGGIIFAGAQSVMIQSHILVHYFRRCWNPSGETIWRVRFIYDKSHLSAASWNSFLFSNWVYYIFQSVHVYHTFPGLALFTDGLNKFFCLSTAFVQGDIS